LSYLFALSVLQQNTELDQVREAVTRDEPVLSITDPSASVPQPASAAVNEDEVDIDLGDPEVQKAAVFIQTGFKGFKQRKISQGLAKVDFAHLRVLQNQFVDLCKLWWRYVHIPSFCFCT